MVSEPSAEMCPDFADPEDLADFVEK